VELKQFVIIIKINGKCDVEKLGTGKKWKEIFFFHLFTRKFDDIGFFAFVFTDQISGY